jgi:hypothetical protein
LVVVLGALNLLLAGTLIAGVVVRSDAARASEPFLELQADAVETIRIFRASGETVLERAGDEWRLVLDGSPYPARADRVGQLLDVLSTAQIEREVSTREEQLPALGLDDSARRVVLTGDAFSVDLVFGPTAASAEQVYALEPGTRRAVLVSGTIDFYLTQSESFWAYLRLLPESVRGGEISRLDMFVDGGPVRVQDPAALRAVADLVGNGFYEGTMPGPPDIRLDIEMLDGRRFALELERLDDFWVAVPFGPALPGESFGGLRYSLADATADRLLDLLGAPPDRWQD